jgi:hypothetical protein
MLSEDWYLYNELSEYELEQNRKTMQSIHSFFRWVLETVYEYMTPTNTPNNTPRSEPSLSDKKNQ